MPDQLTISDAIARYLDTVQLARSIHTVRAYANGLNAFAATLAEHKLPPADTDLQALPEDAVAWFAAQLKAYAPATEQLYLTAAVGFYKFLVAENLLSANLPRIEMLVNLRARKPGLRLPQFPRSEIEQMLSYAQSMTAIQADGDQERLQILRDRAFILTLATTGLRVHEACALRRGDIDWAEGRALLIGKGDREAVVRFATSTLRALKDYLQVRAPLDGASGRPLPSLPIFARHDRGAGRKIKPITTTTGRNIIKQRVTEALGEEAAQRITPHSFRHYFVTTVLVGSGGNLKLAQELARHRNIAVTQRYAHLSDAELDRGYHEIFETGDSDGDS